ncbi:Pseudouridine-5'-phosphate glycosidase, partial [Cryptotermes secundus]
MQTKLAYFLRNRVYAYFRRRMSSFNYNSCIDVSQEVSEALRSHSPVVALESTIISHGMPYPANLQTALQVEEVIRNQGAVPATIAVIKGRVKVGLDQEMLSEFASLKTPAVKTSRRDFPYVLSKGLNGGTTVAGTVIVSSAVGIKVFATGGLGGVHRGGEMTMDISADLTELGRNPVTVVSSGIKSILDIDRTLEYLETQGVCVVTYGQNKNFPSFYTPESGLEAPYNVETPAEAAALIEKLLQLRLNSGILLAVPIPEAEAMEGGEIEKAINTAVKEAEDHGIRGKEVTPFILNQVISLTGGRSLASNIALIKNNAKVGAQVALELARIQKNSSLQSSSEGVFQSLHGTSVEQCATKSPLIVVIGGSVLDSVVAVKETSIL